MISCPKCGKSGRELIYYWKPIGNDKKHLGVNCPECERWVKWAPQVEPYVSWANANEIK